MTKYREIWSWSFKLHSNTKKGAPNRKLFDMVLICSRALRAQISFLSREICIQGEGNYSTCAVFNQL